MKYVMSLLIIGFYSLGSVPAALTRQAAAQIVEQIQRSDYEGNREALRRSYDDLAPFLESGTLAARVRYWRGFAMWRRAINGFNESVDPKDLEQDLNQALQEFKELKTDDVGYADARIAMVSCLGYIIFLNQQDGARIQEIVQQLTPLAKEAKALAPENPRLYWVMGPNIFITPAERGGGQEKALETYKKGLEFARKPKGSSHDALEPTWGEAELQMNLAWSNLNKSSPDLGEAERNARAALALVPYWHYVRDILLPQIIAARAKASAQ
jgi:hypothetical protein